MQRAGLILFFVASNALAHPHHGSAGWLSADLWHLLSEPDHLAMILAPLVVGGLWLMRRRLLRRGARADS